MKQIVISKNGGPETLLVQSVSSPEPSEGEVRIRVKYSGINFADLLCRLGLYPGSPKPPFVPGYEVTGVVEKAGDDSLKHWEGKSVLAVTEFGGYSSEVVVNSRYLIPLEKTEDMEAAAAIPVNYFTAYGMMVTQANLQKNEWILIHGIGGGVGIAALQVANILGAKIIGTASAPKHDRLRTMGVRHLIDYNHQDFVSRVKEITGGMGADVILDPIGGANMKRSYKALAPLGRLVNYGFSTAATLKRRLTFQSLKEFLTRMKIDPLKLMLHNKGVFGFHLGRLQKRQDFHEKVVNNVMGWFNQGAVYPVIDRVYPFSEVQNAHRYIHEHKNFGKVLLTPDD